MPFGRNPLTQTAMHRDRRWTSVLHAVVVLVSLATVATNADAIDRNEARLRRLLLGRHDEARVAAMRSIPREF